MISDDERREVAERLRAYGKEFGDPTWRELCNVVFWDDDRYPSAVRKLHLIDRLADLIDPGESGHESGQNRDTVSKESPTVQKAPETCEYWLDGECYARRTVRPVDCEALLALADELEEDACWEVQTSGDTSGAWRLKDVCDRIREALGVES